MGIEALGLGGLSVIALEVYTVPLRLRWTALTELQSTENVSSTYLPAVVRCTRMSCVGLDETSQGVHASRMTSGGSHATYWW